MSTVVVVDDIHAAWLAGWEAGYAQGAQVAAEDRVRAIQHAEAVRWTEQAVKTATARHGEAWGQTIREQAEGGEGP